MDAKPHELDALLAHAGWARALARGLVRDEHAADDLVQRTWLAAMRRPPDGATPPRRWLATVMRNLARDHARESSRRLARERVVARTERVDPVGDAVAAHTQLVAAVDALPEPYRSAVWARYYDGLAPRAIAARDGVPIETVKSRITRGLELLRKRFDREHGGDRGAWVALFLPLAQPDPVSSLSLGTLIVQTKWKLALVAAAAAVVIGGGAWIAASRGDEPNASALAASIEPPAVHADAIATRAIEVPDEHASRVLAHEPEVAPTPVAAAPVAMLRGRVIDFDRRPVANLEIGSADRDERTDVVSAADGTFEIAAELVGNALEARGPGWATVWTDRHEALRADESVTILVARAGRIAGVVLDHEGRPAPRAFVTTRTDKDARRALSDVLAPDPHEIARSAYSDEHGRFDLGETPLVRGTIAAVREDREAEPVAIPTSARDDVELRLGGLPPGIVARGRVLDAEGRAVDAAVVALAEVATSTRTDGTYELVVKNSAPADRPLELVAAHPGALAARVAFASREELERAASRPIDLVLRGASLAISGRVVDPDGRPIAGVHVTIEDEEGLGVLATEWCGVPTRRYVSLESIARGGPYVSVAITGEDGSFTIDGLQDRAYMLRATAEHLSLGRDVRDVAGGTRDLLVVLDTRTRTQRVAGRVVDGLGRPMAGAQVWGETTLPDLADPLRSVTVRTDAEGAFEIASVRGLVASVTAAFDSRGSLLHPQPGEPLDELRIVIARMRAVQIDATSDASAATRFEIHDARFGGPTSLCTRQSVVSRTSAQVSTTGATTLPFVDGRSDVVSVLEGELSVVLFRGDAEVRRIPLVLADDGTTIVRL